MRIASSAILLLVVGCAAETIERTASEDLASGPGTERAIAGPTSLPGPISPSGGPPTISTPFGEPQPFAGRRSEWVLLAPPTSEAARSFLRVIFATGSKEKAWRERTMDDESVRKERGRVDRFVEELDLLLLRCGDTRDDHACAKDYAQLLADLIVNEETETHTWNQFQVFEDASSCEDMRSRIIAWAIEDLDGIRSGSPANKAVSKAVAHKRAVHSKCIPADVIYGD
jgi:hypothetical protein